MPMLFQTSLFGGEDVNKLVLGIRCEGTEEKLWKCYHQEIRNVVCPQAQLVAGVVCTNGQWRYFTVRLKH